MSTSEQKKSASVPAVQSLNTQNAVKKQVNKSSSSSSLPKLLINLFLIGAIVFVYYSSSAIKKQLNKTQQILAKRLIPQPEEPVKVQKPKPASNKKNVMCPSAQQDLDSCLQKLNRCKKTEVEFQSAQQQFIQLISDCAKSNDQNQRINDQMQKQILQMEENLKQIEKL